MCGVVGVIGNLNIQEQLIKGLETLEYRGYDSAGIFVMNRETSSLYKEVGRIEKLKQTVDFEFNASMGIGHTRWATHGPATVENAHPHMSQSQRFVLVHNGVIENYAELKETYLSHVTFYSQTDTEVIVNLVEYFVQQESVSTKQAFTKTLSLLKGSYALALIDQEDSEHLYAAKNKSPLLIGLGKDFNVICSDAMAAISVTSEFIEIHDHEVIVLSSNEVQVETLDGKKIMRDSFKAELDVSDLDKGAYPYYMIKEIEEQPAVIRQLVSQYYLSEHSEIEEALLNQLEDSDRIYIVACGTSYHAGLIGKSLFESLLNVPVEVHLASEFAYQLPVFSQKPFFIFLSQSGETADSRQALVKVNELNYPSLTITNVKGSTLSREATHTLLLYAGPEIAVASTKAYTAQIAVLAVLVDHLANYKKQDLPLDMQHELSLIASAMESVISEKYEIESWVNQSLMTTRNAFYIGRLSDYAVSMEAALKLKEISYIQTEAFAAGELKHGTIALIEEGTPVIAFVTQSGVDMHTRANIEEVKARGAKATIISSEALSQSGDHFVVPTVNETLSPLVSVVVAQLISYYTALGRGLDVDKPRNLAKSVTVE